MTDSTHPEPPATTPDSPPTTMEDRHPWTVRPDRALRRRMAGREKSFGVVFILLPVLLWIAHFAMAFTTLPEEVRVLPIAGVVVLFFVYIARSSSPRLVDPRPKGISDRDEETDATTGPFAPQPAEGPRHEAGVADLLPDAGDNASRVEATPDMLLPEAPHLHPESNLERYRRYRRMKLLDRDVAGTSLEAKFGRGLAKAVLVMTALLVVGYTGCFMFEDADPAGLITLISIGAISGAYLLGDWLYRRRKRQATLQEYADLGIDTTDFRGIKRRRAAWQGLGYGLVVLSGGILVLCLAASGGIPQEIWQQVALLGGMVCGIAILALINLRDRLDPPERAREEWFEQRIAARLHAGAGTTSEPGTSADAAIEEGGNRGDPTTQSEEGAR